MEIMDISLDKFYKFVYGVEFQIIPGIWLILDKNYEFYEFIVKDSYSIIENFFLFQSPLFVKSLAV